MKPIEQDIKEFQQTIREYSGYDFTDYSISSLKRRLGRISLEFDLELHELSVRMSRDQEFLEKIVRKITVHTTELFRDPEIWIALRQELLPILDKKDHLSIWHSGCSSGQEVYSMMMVLDEMEMLDKTSILATDLNPDVLELARKGRYKYHFNQSYLENFAKVLPLARHRKKYFMVDEARDAIQMSSRLREKPVFQQFDLALEPTRLLESFDLIVCRNVIIYFNQNLQNRVFELFHRNLNREGILWLGVHEAMMGPLAQRFNKSALYYQKKEG